MKTIKEMIGEWWYEKDPIDRKPEEIYKLVLKILKIYGKGSHKEK